jgi:HD superfamily phosphohydrolase YqeK
LTRSVTHPTLGAAATGILPDWAVASPGRKAHLARVADLMERWAGEIGVGPEETIRWRAAGLLHDALRDAEPWDLRPLVEPELQALPDEILHGPAAAACLRRDGVRDEPLLLAIAWHTVGHPGLDRMGRALYLADHLEPGRGHASALTEALRARLPAAMDAVLVELAAERIAHTLGYRQPLLEPTVRFWNDLVQP